MVGRPRYRPGCCYPSSSSLCCRIRLPGFEVMLMRRCFAVTKRRVVAVPGGSRGKRRRRRRRTWYRGRVSQRARDSVQIAGRARSASSLYKGVFFSTIPYVPLHQSYESHTHLSHTQHLQSVPHLSWYILSSNPTISTSPRPSLRMSNSHNAPHTS
jgi:hypothetical protein